MEGDIELDAEGMQGEMGSAQPVRKAISLKLKKTKVKVKSSKSSKSKKEKRSSQSEHREIEESKNPQERELRSPRKTKSSGHSQQFPRHAKEDLEWDHKIMLIGEKVQDPMIHICEKCSLPVLVYGRLSPCKHVFCLTCAEKSNGKCPRCEDRVERIEPAGIGQIFVCSFGGSRHGISGCRRSYLSQRDLLAHIRHRHQRDAPASEAEIMRNLEQQHQQAARMPFFGNQFMPANIRPNFGQIHPGQIPVDSRMMPSTIPPSSQTFMEAPRMHLTGQFPPAPGPGPAPVPGQFQAISQPMSQPGIRPEQTAMQAPRPPAPAPVGSVYQPHSTNAQFTATVPVSRPGQPGMPPGSVPYPEGTGQFMPANIPSSRVETLPPGSMAHGHVEGAFTQSRVDTASMPRGPVDGSWRPGGPPPPGHVRPPHEDWQAQGRADMSSGFPGERPRYPAPYYK